MEDLFFRIYCILHLCAKKVLGRNKLSSSNIFKRNKLVLGADESNSHNLWQEFIDNSKITNASNEYVSHFAGYISENEEWCLPSWVWTTASIVRMYCNTNQIDKAIEIAEKLALEQQDCGGWIVRNDYDKNGAMPIIAPNDSAYIANNAFLSLYNKTNNKKYLEIASRCADWIIATARQDGIVYTGYNKRDEIWDTNCVIVDTGFTLGLFCNLYIITQEQRFLNFIKKFTKRYIELFYIAKAHAFCTSIDNKGRQQGGIFGRGQAWALEGLIPAYKILKDREIKRVIEETIDNLINKQNKDGSWAYNFAKPFMGKDCKAVSVIAWNLMDWYKLYPNDKILQSANSALSWCHRHTSIKGISKGGIFSFCLEGAIVHNLYSSCAFVYSSAYAIELETILRK